MADTGILGSVIIPAWNEEAVIGRTLDHLFASIDDGALEVVVACNGCTDDTAGAVRRTGSPVRLLELPAVGKTGAIRAAESVAASLPRLYLDADVVLDGPAAIAVLSALRDGVVAARPPFRYDDSGASWLVRCFYRQRMRLPSIQADLCGAGVYGLSATARSRFGEFPDVTADDLFAARIVDSSEVEVVPCDEVIVTVPRDARSLVRMLERVHRGNRELARLMPDRAGPTTRSTIAQLVRSVSSPRDVVDAAVYAVLVTVARARGRRSGSSWGRDETSRDGVR